ncbi:recombinase family protein [uncultured Dysosmobacter sp.]|uniref:recombinase family protein n=1 Tax=uncultured Dysosmobacter sp. TaxID=2591384 RepID=UPI00260DC0E1|nr:recombinase family protein [uncultured Dysosmobacter sp.]
MSETEKAPRRITVIPADPALEERDIRKQHLRVAPYCRVSTDKDEQLSSYEAQIEYYTEKINANREWTMVRLYADEGKTGTSTKKRKEFLKMIRDCEKGKIDLIITKSVSRFGRNTLDGLDYVRRLKRIGVGVYFEKENVNTLYMDNEMILTFFFSQAQAESESLSGNVKWGHRKNFKDGKVYYQYESFLGYRKGADGQPEVDEEQAAVVRRIFARYLMGHSTSQICKDLMADGIKTVRGKDRWRESVIQRMLQNEKYIGDALLQKTYMADLFTHQQKKNTGELPKYYVHECHPPIIDRETFRRVQEEMARRSGLRKTSDKAKTELGKYSGKYALNELLVCGECGSPYRRRLWMPRGERRHVWRCLNRLEHGKKYCKNAPTLEEPALHAAILSAINEMFQARVAKQILMDSIAAVLSRDEQEQSLPAVESQIRRLQDRQLELFQLAVSAGVECTAYDDELQQVHMAKTRLMLKKAELERLGRTASEFDRRMDQIESEVDGAEAAITDFDEVLVRQLISNIKVLDKEHLLIRFKDGMEIEQYVDTEKEMRAS